MGEDANAIGFIFMHDSLVFGIGVFGAKDSSVKDGWQLKLRCIVENKEENSFIVTSKHDNKDSERKKQKCIFRNHGGKLLKLSKS